jgi:hypothetical protein
MLERREFLQGAVLAGGLGLVPLSAAIVRAEAQQGTRTASREALAELVATIQDVDRTYLSPARGIERPGDVADGHRLLMHVLEGSIDLEFESDPDHPVFKRIVSPTRKANGDNPDAIYFRAPLSGGRRYRIRGNLAGATYTSFTIEAGAGGGRYASRTAGVLNDTTLVAQPDGSFEITLSAERAPGNWLALPDDAAELTTRHYFERERSVAADPNVIVPLAIECLDTDDPPPTWDDARIAAGIRRVTHRVRGLTLEQPIPDPAKLPSWVSTVPNRFNAPEKPGELAFAAFDAAYTMAPYALGPDQALEIVGRMPKCRFANVVLWTRFLQSYDYVHRQISLNREQMQLDADGGFRIVLAHRDPGVANWLDTEGRPSGTVYWRFMLPEGDVPTPVARVIPLANAKG